MLNLIGKQRLKRHLQVISILGLAVLFWSGLAAGQEKKEPIPVTSSRSFQLTGYTQGIYSYLDEGTDTFIIRRARLALTGDLTKSIKLKLQVDVVRSPVLVDAQIDVSFKPYFNLRAGQFYLPFSRENRISAGELDTVLRAQVVEKLGPGRDIGSLGRDIGVMVVGKASIVEYMAGIFNGAGINKLDTNEHKDFAGRVVVSPTNFLFVGGSVYRGRYSAALGDPEVTRDRAGLEGLLTLGPFSFRSEYIAGKDSLTSKSGWYLLGLYNVLPKKLQAVVKWDSYDQDRDTPADRTDLLTLGGNYYFSEKTKLMVNYVHYGQETKGTTNWALFLQFQAGF
jgi:phosphate-selective porin